jgi:hypothetical protein
VAFVAGLKIDARLCGVLQREGQSEIFNRLGMIYAVWSIGLVGSISGIDSHCGVGSSLHSNIALPTAL